MVRKQLACYICVYPEVPENVPKTIEHAYKYWFDNLTLLRKLARENMICSKLKQKIQYDRHTRPHNFRVGDKVFIKIHQLKENEDSKLRQQYRGIYTINSFLSQTNVILTDENGRQLSRSVYINNLKKYSDRKQFNIADDQLVQQNGLDNAKSEEDNSSLSDQSEYEDEIPQHSENDVNHEVVNSNQHQENGDMNNNNNNILFYSANIQFNKNLFSALYKRKCVQHVLTRTCK